MNVAYAEPVRVQAPTCGHKSFTVIPGRDPATIPRPGGRRITAPLTQDHDRRWASADCSLDAQVSDILPGNLGGRPGRPRVRRRHACQRLSSEQFS